MICPKCHSNPGTGYSRGIGFRNALKGQFKCKNCGVLLELHLSSKSKILTGVFLVFFYALIGTLTIHPELFSNPPFNQNLIPVFAIVFSLFGIYIVVHMVRNIYHKEAGPRDPIA